MTTKLNRNFVLYMLIGLSGVTLDLIVFFVLFNFFHVEKNLATFISISLAITNNFLLNTYLNFKVTDHLLHRYGRFYLVGLCGIALTSVVFFVFVDQLHIDANIVKVGSLLPVLLLQYSLNKRWSFREETTNA